MNHDFLGIPSLVTQCYTGTITFKDWLIKEQTKWTIVSLNHQQPS